MSRVVAKNFNNNDSDRGYVGVFLPLVALLNLLQMLHYHRKPYNDECSGMDIGGTLNGAEVTTCGHICAELVVSGGRKKYYLHPFLFLYLKALPNPCNGNFGLNFGLDLQMKLDLIF